MKWTSWVGYRYLKSKKNSQFLSFITLLSMLGVGIGVTSMIVVLSVMDGFESQLKKRLMSADLHVLITPTEQVTGYSSGRVPESTLDAKWVEDFKKREPEVDTFWRVISTEGIFRSGRKVAGVVLKGVSPERISKLRTQLTESVDPQILKSMEREGNSLPGIFVGQELAYEQGVIPGDQISIISPTEFDGPAQSIPRLKKFVIEGIYHSGLPEQELSTVFTGEGFVRSFLRSSGVVSQWEVSVKDFDSAPIVAQKLKAALPQFKVQDWNELNSHLFASLRLERISMFVALAFIVVVASFNIVTTLTLMVLEKKKEISILKAMGAKPNEVGAIFVSEGLLIGGVGVLGGNLLGALLCLTLRRYDFIKLPDIYYDTTLPVTFNLNYYVGVSGCAFVIVLLACFYPSWRASKLNPLDGIRFG